VITPVNRALMQKAEKVFDKVLNSIQEEKLKNELAAKGIQLITSENMKIAAKEYVCPFDSKTGAIAMELGDMHNSKYFKLSFPWLALDELKAYSESTDYTGMTNAEKYTAIYSRYAEAFGDFMPAGAIDYTSDAQSIYARIFTQFGAELTRVFGSSAAAADANRVAQYGDKSQSEVRAAIIEKYPPMNQITLREFHEMTWEMSCVGVDDGLHEVLVHSEDYLGYNVGDVNQNLIREELLDKPLDLQHLCNTYNGMLYAGSVTRSAGRVMRGLFGVSFDGRGNAYANNTSVDYKAYIERLFANRSTWTQSDYEKFFFNQ
jgi:hypothetical protein